MSIEDNRLLRSSGTQVWAMLCVLISLAACSSPKSRAAAVSPAVAVVPAPPAGTPAGLNKPGTDANTADQYVAAVRRGTITGYPSASIGKAFETAFLNPEWHSQQTKDGERLVNFTGVLPAGARQDCRPTPGAHDTRPCSAEGRVSFQWAFSPDARLFHLNYIDTEPWPEARRSTREILLFIFEQ